MRVFGSKDGVGEIRRPTDTLSGLLFEAGVQARRNIGKTGPTPETAGRTLWLAAIFLAVGWHALWWVMLSPNRVPLPMNRLAMSRLAYSAPGAMTGRGGLAREAEGVQSPVLFALPTAEGFSGAALTRELVLLPPVEPPAKSGMLIPFETVQAIPEPSEQERGTWLAGVSTPLMGPPPPVFAAASEPDTSGVVELYFSDSLGAEPMVLSPPDVPAGKRWEARALVVVDASGGVSQVLLDEPAPSPEWNRALARELRSLAFEPGADGRRGEVVLHYTGAPPQDLPAGEPTP